MLEFLSSPAFWGSLATLTFLEVVLGIDNLLFISIATGKLQGEQKAKATRIGIWGAMFLRIAMLGLIFVIINLDKNALFQMPHWLAVFVSGGDEALMHHVEDVTVKDLILLAGGLFLLWKGTQEIHSAVEGTGHIEAGAKSGFTAVVIQLFVINFVFSLDSVITAIVMAFAADPLAKFIGEHPTTKMLALAFILLVGVALVADGLGFHIPRGYLYFAIAFSLGVELLNIRAKGSKRKTGAH
jgi:predicted tellurium resistance membrane protein TerC